MDAGLFTVVDAFSIRRRCVPGHEGVDLTVTECGITLWFMPTVAIDWTIDALYVLNIASCLCI